MAVLVAAIHVFLSAAPAPRRVDARVKPAHDGPERLP